MKKIIRTLTVLAFSLGLLTAGAVGPAQAVTGPFGGKVSLMKGSTGNLKVGGNLTVRNGKYVLLSPIAWLAPGQNSKTTGHLKDADGFQAPARCSTTVYLGGGEKLKLRAGYVMKIGDFTSVSVLVKC